ncbi:MULTISPECIES: ATP-binding cassette domain-containing protein [unclassified Lysinibacillus]|uniref:ATP-binding cassette domain-containing protein n=1 Tax=unclassified Lysinibacillus TaxID=2636778 RepID=UPI002556CABA|nr:MULTISPECIES: ATP-binding cassette domain-containing protein [unclassified Lysinibacillus]MDM5247121.1 ATP-binding cassette domain-containing protein [Lysinibacillus sp. G4S2]
MEKLGDALSSFVKNYSLLSEFEPCLKTLPVQHEDGNFSRLETHLTKEIKDGAELSGGEWQKVAIARAFLKDAELIVLDEPTSALDPITEMKVFELFHELSRNKTTITISHRIGPTRLSDRILVMEHGQIVEEGSFQELMEKKGLYYEMYQIQARYYEEPLIQNKEEYVT